MTDNVEAYHYQRFFPAGPLASFVKFFYYFHGRSTQPERIVPLSLPEITFSLGGDGGKSFIVPPGSQSYFVVPQTLDRVVGVCFQPYGFHALFGLPADELGKAKVPLADALLIPWREMTERIADASSPQEIVSRLEHYLATRIRKMPNELVRDAVDFIDRQHGLLDLPYLYTHYSQSTRRVQMLFRQFVGMSPKKYSRLKRFHFAVTQMMPADCLTSLALDTGYYDQAHFIHEFRAFAGTNPRNFLRESNQLNAINARSWF